MSYDRDRKREQVNRAWMLRGSDPVAPEHVKIHGDLSRWGAWCRGGGNGPGTCSSIEGMYDNGREVRRPIVMLPPNPMNPRIQRAVWAMTLQHGESIRLYYVRRRSPPDICHLFALKFEDWGRWIYDARNMVQHILAAQLQA